jgi:hypothetical protein
MDKIEANLIGYNFALNQNFPEMPFCWGNFQITSPTSKALRINSLASSTAMFGMLAWAMVVTKMANRKNNVALNVEIFYWFW